MQIVKSPEMVSINLDDSLVYYRLQTIIEKNFPSKIGRKNKIILFYKEEELVQRRYLLKLIAKIYKKTYPKTKKRELEKIENFYAQTIKFSLIQKNQVLPNLQIPINFDDTGAITFTLESHNRLFVSYMKNYFKDHLMRYRVKTKTLTIYPNSNETTKRLNKLFETREHLAWYISFSYSKRSYETFTQYWNNRASRKRHSRALGGILEEYFSILGCSNSDSFKRVRAEYLKLVKLYHPDHNTSKNALTIVHYREKFEQIQIAYEIVKTYYSQDDTKMSA